MTRDHSINISCKGERYERKEKLVIKKRHPKITERLAFHEAGHCIVAHRYGFQFAHVTISPNDELGSEAETLLVQRASSLVEALLTAVGIPNRRKLEQLLVVLWLELRP